MKREVTLYYYKSWEIYCYFNDKEEYYVLPMDDDNLEFETWEDVVGYIDGLEEEEE